MTMIDESTLRDALAEIAEELALPGDGIETILDVALGASQDDAAQDAGQDLAPVDTVAGRRAARYLRSHRAVSVGIAAALVVIVGGITIGGVLGRGGSSSSGGSALSPGGTGGAASPSSRASNGGSYAIPAPSGAGSTSQDHSAPLNTQAAPSAATSPSTATQSPQPLPAGSVGTNEAIEKTGSVVLTVHHGKLAGVIDQLTAVAAGTGGFVADTQTQQEDGVPTGTITLEVPAADFETVLNQVRSLGKVDSTSTKATDVTGQVVDLKSRIQALQDSLAQYEKILSQAYSIGDVLTVQSQIDSIQSQIEQLQGQQNLLNAVTIFSTLAVSVSESTPPGHPAPAPKPPARGIGKAWHDTVSGFAAAFDALVAIAGPLLFALLCLVAVIVAGRFAWRATRRWLL